MCREREKHVKGSCHGFPRTREIWAKRKYTGFLGKFHKKSRFFRPHELAERALSWGCGDGVLCVDRKPCPLTCLKSTLLPPWPYPPTYGRHRVFLLIVSPTRPPLKRRGLARGRGWQPRGRKDDLCPTPGRGVGWKRAGVRWLSPAPRTSGLKQLLLLA